MKWAHQAQWGTLGQKESQETPEDLDSLLQAFLEKKVPQAPQGGVDLLVLQVPEEGLLKVKSLTRVYLETRDLLALMVQEDYLGPQDPREVLTC